MSIMGVMNEGPALLSELKSGVTGLLDMAVNIHYSLTQV